MGTYKPDQGSEILVILSEKVRSFYWHGTLFLWLWYFIGFLGGNVHIKRVWEYGKQSAHHVIHYMLNPTTTIHCNFKWQTECGFILFTQTANWNIIWFLKLMTCGTIIIQMVSNMNGHSVNASDIHWNTFSTIFYSKCTGNFDGHN